MYKDEDDWPFKCPECGEEFTEKIGRLKTQTPTIAVKCPGIVDPLGPIPCSVTLRYSAEEFRLALAKAKAGRHDPFRHRDASVAIGTVQPRSGAAIMASRPRNGDSLGNQLIA
jgi:hypothetical protein